LDAAYASLSNDAVTKGAKGVLDEAVAHAKAKGVQASGEAKIGDAAGVLVEESKQAGLAVVGTRGRGGFAERLLGTVSSALPVHSHCPTVVVPLGDRAKDGEAREFQPVRHIVVGVDGSKAAQVALRIAFDEALAWGAELTAISSMPMAAGSSLFAWAPGPVDQGAILDELEAELERILQAEVANRTLPADFKLNHHAMDGSASALMVEFSEQVDLLVVGSRGRGGFSGLLLGSTSQAVLHHAACPVMVVPARIGDAAEAASSEAAPPNDE